MVKLRNKRDFSDEMIVSFQKDMDAFFQIWVVLFTFKGISNYIHMLASGHIAACLFHWRNLYRYSQQGWEAFNALLKTFFFRRTQRGGTYNKGRGKKTRLVPIGRWLQRRIIWMCAFEPDEIKSWNKANPPRDDDEDEEVEDVHDTSSHD